MSKLFVPMYTTMPCHYQTRRPQRRWNRCPASMYQPSFLDMLLAGVLGQLQAEADSKEARERRHPWVHRINLKGFQPKDVSVKVEDHTVHVHANHVEETDTGRDVMEKYRKVNLPTDVDVGKLSCFLDESENLIMKAPFVARCPTDVTCTKNQSGGCCKQSPEKELDEKKGDQTDVVAEDESIDLPIEHQDKDDTNKRSTEPEPPKESISDERPLSNDVDNNQDTAPIISEVESDTEGETGMGKQETDLPTGADSIVMNVDELTSERSFDILENHPSRPNSPQDSIEFVIFDKDGQETNTSTNKQTNDPTHTDNNADSLDTEIDDAYSVKHQANADDSSEANTQPDSQPVLPKDRDITIQDMDKATTNPVTDIATIRDVDGQKQYEITVNLQDYKPENTSIQFKDGCLRITAEEETETDSLKTFQKVLREYTLPKQGVIDKAEAAMNSEGILRVTVPLNMDN